MSLPLVITMSDRTYCVARPDVRKSVSDFVRSICYFNQPMAEVLVWRGRGRWLVDCGGVREGAVAAAVQQKPAKRKHRSLVNAAAIPGALGDLRVRVGADHLRNQFMKSPSCRPNSFPKNKTPPPRAIPLAYW